MDLTLTYRALASGQVDFIAGDSTTGLINALDLVHLEDNRRYFPPYDAAPVARAETLLAHPEVRRALERLGGRISEEKMRALNYAADVDRKDIRTVVREFRAANGLP
jgi:glycine betaine/choline ABC-type transport system substrate-binding protein